MRLSERFTETAELKRSSFAITSQAKEARTGLEVIVTRAAPDAPAELLRGFEALQKADALRRVRASSVARLVDLGHDDDGRPYLVTEAVDGPTLQERIVDGPALRLDQAVRLCADLLGGLSTLHRLGLAHGDVEPGNVRLVEGKLQVSPRLIGLGFNRAPARAALMSVRDPRHLYTLAFAAPAQARDGVVADAASDVYSTAAVLYTLLTGELPHQGRDPVTLRRSIARSEVRPVAEARSDVPELLADVVDRALSADPKARFEDAAALQRELRGTLLRCIQLRSLETVVGPVGLEGDVATTEADGHPGSRDAAEREETEEASEPGGATRSHPPEVEPAAAESQDEPEVTIGLEPPSGDSEDEDEDEDEDEAEAASGDDSKGEPDLAVESEPEPARAAPASPVEPEDEDDEEEEEESTRVGDVSAELLAATLAEDEEDEDEEESTRVGSVSPQLLAQTLREFGEEEEDESTMQGVDRALVIATVKRERVESAEADDDEPTRAGQTSAELLSVGGVESEGASEAGASASGEHPLHAESAEQTARSTAVTSAARPGGWKLLVALVALGCLVALGFWLHRNGLLPWTLS